MDPVSLYTKSEDPASSAFLAQNKVSQQFSAQTLPYFYFSHDVANATRLFVLEIGKALKLSQFTYKRNEVQRG